MTFEPIQTADELISLIDKDIMSRTGNLGKWGVARLCGLQPRALQDFLTKDQTLIDLLDAGLGGRYNVTKLLSNGFTPDAVWTCIDYFATRSPRAGGIVKTFGAIGLQQILRELGRNKADSVGERLAADYPKPMPEVLAAKDIYEISKVLDEQPELRDILIRSLLSRYGIKTEGSKDSSECPSHEPLVVAPEDQLC